MRTMVMHVTVLQADIRQIEPTGNPMEPVVTNHVELITQATELTADEMERVSGGGAALVGHKELIPDHLHPVNSPGTTMFRPPSKKRPG